jgi:hypothetical protein
MVTINVTLGICCLVLSFGFFVLCRYLVRPLTFIRLTTKNNQRISKPLVRTWFTYSNIDQWERLNLLISWLHSLITGLSAIYCFWTYSPDIYRDLVKHLSFVTYLTCSLSCGMFEKYLIK